MNYSVNECEVRAVAVTVPLGAAFLLFGFIYSEISQSAIVDTIVIIILVSLKILFDLVIMKLVTDFLQKHKSWMGGKI
jgi:hypothetical protein